MIRPCDVETRDDFLKYYDGGWVGWAREPGIVSPVMHRGHAGSGVILRPISYKEGGEAELQADVIVDWKEAKNLLSFGCPPLGMLTTKGEVFYGSSLAERHWSRGLRLEKVKFHNFNRWYLRNELGLEKSFGTRNYEAIWKVFNPIYLPLVQACSKLNRGESVGEALSRHFAVYTIPSTPYPLLAYKRWTIGFVPNPQEVVIGEQFRDYEEDLEKQFQVGVRII